MTSGDVLCTNIGQQRSCVHDVALVLVTRTLPRCSLVGAPTPLWESGPVAFSVRESAGRAALERTSAGEAGTPSGLRMPECICKDNAALRQYNHILILLLFL